MGCGSSKLGKTVPQAGDPRPHLVQRPQHPTQSHVTQPTPTQHVSVNQSQGRASHGSNSASVGKPKATKAEVRHEFLRMLHAALNDIPYTVIGSSALAEYGNTRDKAVLDVLIGGGFSKTSAECLLIERTQGRIVRLGHDRIAFLAPDGTSYQVDLSTDSDLDQPFDLQRDTQLIRGVRLGTLTFLLNSKAHAWLTRFPFEQNFRQKRDNDARDIAFCLRALKGHRIDRTQAKWICTKRFWGPFLLENPQLEPLFRAADLRGGYINFSSGSSASGRSSINMSE